MSQASRLSLEQAFELSKRYRLHIEPRLFSWAVYTLDSTASPEGHGSTPIAAIENWAWKVWNEPPERWFYSSKHKREIAEEIVKAVLAESRTEPPKNRNISLSDLGL